VSLQNEHADRDAVSMAGQWPPQEETSEQKLWQAVLVMAVSDLRNEHRESAQAWVASDVEAVGSFHWICDILGIDPEYVRSALRGTLPSQTDVARKNGETFARYVEKVHPGN
jgi:hypothetical protein